MGAGCYYTSDIDGERTFWVTAPQLQEEDYVDYTHRYMSDFPEDPEGYLSFEDWVYHEQECVNEWFWDNLVEAFKDKRLKSYHYNPKNRTLSNGLYRIQLEYTYYGDGVVFNFDHAEDYHEGTRNLALANYNKHFYKFIEVLKYHGFTLKMATSGYTCQEI